MMKPLRIGLLGLGTVGAGTVRVLADNAPELEQRTGRALKVVRAAVRDPHKARDCDLHGVQIDADADALVRDPDVDVVVELMGGTERARELVCAALAAGKPVVTANKALIAECSDAVFAAARASGQAVAFEAAVAGGIPIIKVLREGLAGNRIDEVAGIINGTTNYILTRMSQDGVEFAPALAEAQAKGYAEADPTFDVEGIDAAHKLAILAALAFGVPMRTDWIRTIGLTQVSSADIRYAKELGYRVKHLAIARRGAAGIELRVEPTLVPKNSFVAKIDGVMNGVMLSGNAVGSTGLHGPGAGALATASSVVADLVDIALGRALATPLSADSASAVVPAEVETAFYLRMQVADRPGVMKEISTVLAGLEISIEAIVQREVEAEQDATVVLLTHSVRTGALERAVEALQSLPVVHGPIVRMRVEHLEQ